MASKESKISKRAQAAIVFKQKQQQQMEQMNETVILESSSGSDDDVAESTEEGTSELVWNRRGKRKRINIVTPNVVAALDRTKLSDRKATYVSYGSCRSQSWA